MNSTTEVATVTVHSSEPMVTQTVTCGRASDGPELQALLRERFPEAEVLVGEVGKKLIIRIRQDQVDGFWSTVNRCADLNDFKVI